MDENWEKKPPDAPPLAEFKKSNTELPRLEDYRGEFPPWFWKIFTGYDLPETHESWILREKLEEEARVSGYKLELNILPPHSENLPLTSP